MIMSGNNGIIKKLFNRILNLDLLSLSKAKKYSLTEVDKNK